ncbi:MAG: sialate O-acetylesterase [Bacteroidota bacterium]|nr:sialate O-acetylesterase [Bacteroidota bacterium]
MHSNKKIFSSFIFLFVVISANSQIAFTTGCFPTRLQFFARESNDSANLCVMGSIDSSGFDSVECRIIRSSKTFQSIRTKLIYNSGKALFNLSPSIYAGLYEYHIRLYLYKSGIATLIKSADSLVCGDVYMINGQSNSHPSNTSATYSNEYCRSFGWQTDNYNYNSYNPKDTFWGFANGDGQGYSYSGPYMVGVWGIKLMQLLKEKYKMPICIINGGSGGSSIEYNLEYNKLDLNTTYGRLLYRFTKAGLANKIKAIFWHQGESNTNANFTDYITNFDSLYNSWKRDYPSAKKVYVFQIHHGCGGANQQEIREIQRRFPEKYSDVRVMSTVGIHEHDGCHYYLDGYYEMAANISRLVARDFYSYTDTLDIKPPNILKAYYMPGHSAINLIFDNNAKLVWPQDTLGQTMKDYIYTNDSIADIKSYTFSGNSMLLKLSSPSYDSVITYLPNVYYNKVSYIYEGPFIRNKRGVGMLSFYHFPIDSAPPPQANFNLNTQNICMGDSITITDQSLYKPTNWQWQIPGASPSSSNQQNVAIKFDTSGVYKITLIASNAIGVDIFSKNITIVVNTRPTVNAGADKTFCIGDSTSLSVNSGLQYQWIPAVGLSSDTVSDPIAKPNMSTNYIIYVKDKNGCKNSDTIQISIIPLPVVNAGTDIDICNQNNIVFLSGSPQGGIWSGQNINGKQFKTLSLTAGVYPLIYIYSGQCLNSDTLHAHIYNGPIVSIDSIIPVCEGQLFSLSAHGKYANSVLWSSNTNGNFASAIDSSTTYESSSTDNNNGYINLKIVAKGDSICADVYDSMIVSIYPLPSIPIIYSRNDTLFTNAATGWQWMRDTSAISGATQQFTKPLINGTYRVLVTNKFGCMQISDAFTYINTSITNLESDALIVYPNPASTEVIIEANIVEMNSVLQLFDATGRLLHQQRAMGIKTTINVQNFDKGLYIVKLISSSQLYYKKFLVER